MQLALRLHAGLRGLGLQTAARVWPVAQRAGIVSSWRKYTTSPANGHGPQPPIRPGDLRTGAGRAQEGYRRYQEAARQRNASALLYVSAFVIFFLGSSYAAVPLYRLLCKTTGFMGTPKTEPTVRDVETLKPLEGHRRLRVKFAGQVSTYLDWSFKPEQRQVSVVPGETALAFFKAYNNSDKPIVGIATYNVLPDQAAPYFNKIQCFCFDEQQLDPREEIDMPVFFFIDPEFANDPLMDDIDTITLSYTFFKASGR
ncbi:Cytochrome c oxidase assembly protein cox11, mitochondrial [Coemansia spiralis]|uniref:Cytochrome c oxidase assembly protein cox11, mitochondrial n=1 Tax=Coemansia spiralis TaxID=417178 RepID=A0A9W8L6H6_9FUNG|nr:Cytochrome c oxidase assembly protein cox11, mitochondrial [Coemansia spiralis]